MKVWNIIVLDIILIILALYIYFAKPFLASDGCAMGILTGVAVGQTLWSDDDE